MVDIKRRRVSEIVDRVVPTVRLDRQVVPVALNLRQRVGTWLVLPLHLLKRQRRLFSPTRRDLPGRIVNTRVRVKAQRSVQWENNAGCATVIIMH